MSGTAAAGARRKHRAAWLVVAVISALLIVSPMAVETWAYFGAHRPEPSQSIELAPGGRVQRLQVDAGSASVTVRPGPAGQVRVTQKLTWSMKKPQVRKVWDGGVLKVQAVCSEWWSPAGLGCSVKLEFDVPPEIEIQIVGSSGSTDVHGTTGRLDLTSTSGSTTLTDVGGTIWARTGSGTIEGTGLSSRTANVGANSGSLDLAFRSAPEKVTGKVGSGSVRIGVPPGSRYQVVGRSGSGSREYAAGLEDGTSRRVIDATAGSGSVDVVYEAP
ncbi:DUF4097 family beta strand repeat-containing protein [Streptomyces sp. H39-S7]|uniref:DUF4097 family beta strand repeat-containing protein n=1 Tax=Streptomyces sp. H39-S7 TaxID=3004357 RepID=UPI0022B012E6|nr:DUF4097 family beta strand repeat-containing protein [Streptomyces sp. H39-S7]MCZ4121349.1 DUF4097 family beta strand repeat-containing protein [Streptomyces sp. H39-S7]